jgi:hypothetical protein
MEFTVYPIQHRKAETIPFPDGEDMGGLIGGIGITPF